MKFASTAFALTACLALPACTTTMMPVKTPYASARPAFSIKQQQCVPYARETSGIQIYGDAHTWWEKASPRYRRGYYPQTGAVLVLANTRRMTHGHVAVVKNVISRREIDVTHSNWGNSWQTRRMIYDRQRVQDVSAKNDWSSVRFWNYRENSFGFPYAVKGFIYR